MSIRLNPAARRLTPPGDQTANHVAVATVGRSRAGGRADFPINGTNGNPPVPWLVKVVQLVLGRASIKSW